MTRMNWEKLLCPERRRTVQKPYNGLDMRSEFEKDYHRIICSASFRRLQDKTQVFPLDQSDFIRTRLTHSLEVSSIAKSLGQTVGRKLCVLGEMTQEQAQAIADILLCAGLLHDIGNPPFGHFGETVIREWFQNNLPELTFRDRRVVDLLSEQQKQDFYHFEGNAQSLRVVSRLHYLVDDKGMNLTKALCNTIIKYPIPSCGIDPKAGDVRFKKMGYFQADSDIFADVTESTGAGNRRHPLVFLLEAADDIAYSTADLEDGIKKGIISYHKLLYLLENNAFQEHEGSPEYENVVYSCERLKKLFLRGTENQEPDPELYAVQNWVVSMQTALISSAVDSFLDHYDAIMEGTYRADLFADTKSQYLAKLLKKIAFQHVFDSDGIVKLEVAAERILGFHLDSFVRAVINYDTDLPLSERDTKLTGLISPNYKRVYKVCAEGKSEADRLYLRLLLATDFVSGMTDHYAKDLYRTLSGIY